MNTSIQEKIKNDKILSEIANKFPDTNIYVVGGTVRDYLLGKESYDKDIVVITDNIEDFSKKIQTLFPSTLITLDEKNKIYRVILKNSEDIHNPYMIDVTIPEGNNIEKDLARRDLTINAIAAEIHSGEIIDIFGGITDIKNHMLNHIQETNFTDDPLRLLRVYRFQATLGFDISVDTVQCICEYSNQIQNPARERILYELMKLFDGCYTAKALTNMNKTWILEEIFPIVKELKQVPPNSHHHLDLLHHSIETVKQIQKIYDNSDDRVKIHLDETDFGGFRRLAHLKLAGFLHDIGKYSTWTIEPDTGRHRFIKHDDVGSKLVKPLLKALTCSNKQIDYVSQIIKNHIYPSSMMQEEGVNEKAMLRYFRKLESNVIDNIILAKADRLSARGPAITDEMIKNNIEKLDYLIDFYFKSQEKLQPLPKLIDGNEITDITGIKGKELGILIKEIKELQMDGKLNTKEEVIRYLSTGK